MILFHYRVQAFVNYHNRVSISDRIRVSITFDTQVFDHLCRLNSNISAVSEPTSQSASLLISQAVQSLTSTSSRPINQPTGSQVRLRVFMFHLFQKNSQFCSKFSFFLKKYSQNGVRTKIKNCSWSRLKSHPHVVWFSRRFLMSLSRAGLKIFTKTESELISISGWFLRREYSKMKNQFY